MVRQRSSIFSVINKNDVFKEENIGLEQENKVPKATTFFSF
jgi:hypothetical protein